MLSPATLRQSLCCGKKQQLTQQYASVCSVGLYICFDLFLAGRYSAQAHNYKWLTRGNTRRSQHFGLSVRELSTVHGGTKYWHNFMHALTLSNINQLLHCQNCEKICNNTVTKDPTTPQVCRYTTLTEVIALPPVLMRAVKLLILETR